MRIRTKVTRHGEVTIPRKIRQRFNVKAGDTVVFEVEKDRVFLHFPDADPVPPEQMHEIIRGLAQVDRGAVVTYTEEMYRD